MTENIFKQLRAENQALRDIIKNVQKVREAEFQRAERALKEVRMLQQKILDIQSKSV